MKRITLISVTLLVAASMLLSACQATATPTQAVQPTSAGQAQPTQAVEATKPVSGKIQVATNAEFAPFEFVDETTKEVSGFDIDLIKAIGQKAGFEVEIINTGFDAMLAGIASCQYDAGIAAITITEERQKNVLFSQPYTVAGQTVVVAINNETIKGKEDLSGKTIGAQIGTTGAEEVTAIEGAKLKTYDNYEFAFLDLSNGQIDAVVVDNPIAEAYVAKNVDKLKTVGNVFTSESYGIAICKNMPELQKSIDDALTMLKADGTLKTLEEKWLVPQQK